MEYDAELLGKWSPTFRYNSVASSSTVKDISNLEHKTSPLFRKVKDILPSDDVSYHRSSDTSSYIYDFNLFLYSKGQRNNNNNNNIFNCKWVVARWQWL